MLIDCNSNKNNLKQNAFLALSTLMFIPLVSLVNFSPANAQDMESTDVPKEVENVSDNINSLMGKEVIVRGNLQQTISEEAFTLENKPFPEEIIDGDKILILNTSNNSIPQLPEEDDQLQVNGTVGTFVLADVEQKYGVDLDDQLYINYENQPVIFADMITLAPSPREISGEPEYYYGKSVAVKGEVGKIVGTNTFTISRGEVVDAINDITGRDDLLVLNLTGEAIPVENTDLTVIGVVRPFIVTELEKEYDLNWDLEVKEKLEAEYSERPVLVVDSMAISAE